MDSAATADAQDVYRADGECYPASPLLPWFGPPPRRSSDLGGTPYDCLRPD